jgi:hypothetical protein
VENELITLQQDQDISITKSDQYLTMWNDKDALSQAWKAANMLCKTDLVPDNYKGKPENCLIALDVANRTHLSPLMVMQGLTVVRGRPAWNGQSSIALVNGSGRFTPLDFIYSGENNNFGCVARAMRLENGSVCESERVTIQMAIDEGWSTKPGSKWKTMPRLMMQYRSGAFFARAYCPDLLLGIQTAEETMDVRGYDAPEKKTTTIVLDAEVTE